MLPMEFAIGPSFYSQEHGLATNRAVFGKSSTCSVGKLMSGKITGLNGLVTTV